MGRVGHSAVTPGHSWWAIRCNNTECGHSAGKRGAKSAVTLRTGSIRAAARRRAAAREIAERGTDGRAPVGESCGHGEDALGADGVEEPGDEGAGQTVPRVDNRARVIQQDQLAELGVGVRGLAGRDVGDVEGLDLGQLGSTA